MDFIIEQRKFICWGIEYYNVYDSIGLRTPHIPFPYIDLRGCGADKLNPIAISSMYGYQCKFEATRELIKVAYEFGFPVQFKVPSQQLVSRLCNAIVACAGN